MNLSVECYVMSEKYGDFKAFDMIKKAGFDSVDYSFYSRKDAEKIFGDNFREYAKELKKYLDEIGLYCNQAHAPFELNYSNKLDESEPKFVKLIKSIEFASILGAKTIVVHPQFDFGYPEIDPDEYNVNYLKTLVPYCEKFGICVAMENCFAPDFKRKCYKPSVASTPDMLKDILRKANSPWVVGCLDVGHSAVVGVEPEDFIMQMDKYTLKALHVHDNDYLFDRHTLPYVCNFNWENIMKSLKKIGYEGELNFEIIEYLKKFPEELLFDALSFAEKVGRYLISIYDAA